MVVQSKDFPSSTASSYACLSHKQLALIGACILPFRSSLIGFLLSTVTVSYTCSKLIHPSPLNHLPSLIIMTDYLIVGGGLAGCVLASRLKELDASVNIMVVETGPNEHENPLITEPMGTMQLNGSQYQYNYKTVPQKHYDGRQVFQAGGKVLSGSSAV